MDVFDDVKLKSEAHVFQQPIAKVSKSSVCHRRTVFGRRSKLLVVVASVVTLVWYHYDFLHDTELPNPVPRSPQNFGADDFDWYALSPSRDLNWTSCYSGEKCARLLLPLDYDTPDSPATAIALRMIPATDLENYRGTIFLNPGGPGGSGTDFVRRVGQNISRVVGPSFDILGFDPRGTGRSTPSRDIWDIQEGHQLLNASDSSLGLFHSRAKLLAQRCEDRLGGEWGIGRFVTTANVVSDMLQINKQLGQDKLQYWGFSYGSVLGQYFAAMHPDKVKRLIVDGVYEAEDYRRGRWGTNIVDAEHVADAFFTFCHQAGAEKCSLHDSSPERIRERFLRVLDEVEKSPVGVPGAEPPAIVTRKALITQLFFGSYKPLVSYPIIANTIRALETGDQNILTALAPQLVNLAECQCDAVSDLNNLADNEATYSIACSDSDGTQWDEDAFREHYATLEGQSPLGAPLWAYLHMQCLEWKIRPKTRWTGSLGAQSTSHPILVLSARYDPVTPLADARLVQTRFGGAGLLVQESYGHCSLSSPSLCTARHVREYFINGTLPEEGAVCGVDELPFIGSVQGDVQTLSSEDAELLDALRDAATAMPVYNRL
ncbi:alpha/beta-hydrolase [Dichomitus squalens]|uniref:Alpha/beta-hydrolase n=1 Tax=Dichomitus squalens TaxID=114155 RepID=A0A4Q9Q360_9APHY|nr:alpha/beta-hydrolase [Dichomitus squalens]